MPRDDHGYGWFCCECGSEHWTEEFVKTAAGPMCLACAEPLRLVPELVPASTIGRYQQQEPYDVGERAA